MSTLLAATAHSILMAALDSDYGIVVRIQPTTEMVAPTLRAKQVLYRFKKDNAEFENIQIRLSPDDPDRDLWLLNMREPE